MQSPTVIKRHVDLVDRMADTLGVDLEEAALCGQVSSDEISDAVLRCTACSNPNHCDGWLASRDTADDAPAYCRNRDLLRSLKP
ncbi:MAG: hypothetical protein GDA40_08810 [Rhodobacteraceae bacterium]|nr:hypothetical protein [Paracoccaceae bacterium]